jgi:hypothetical protein
MRLTKKKPGNEPPNTRFVHGASTLGVRHSRTNLIDYHGLLPRRQDFFRTGRFISFGDCD